MNNILLTGIGGVTPQSIAKSLRISNEKYKIVGVDSSITANGLYMKNLFDSTYLVPVCTCDEYYNKLNKIIKKESIELVIISPDFEVQEVSRNRHKLNAKVILPDDKLIQVITDKIKTYEYLSSTDFVPKFTLIHTEKDLLDFTDKYGTPFWVRNFVGTSGLGSLKIESFEQAKFWIDYNNGWSHFMASEYLPGRNFGFQVVFKDGELISSACYERKSYIMGKVAPSGISGNAAYGVFVHRADINKIAVESINILCSKLGIKAHGMLTVDLKEDENGVPKLTEINPRHIAPTYCFAKAGVNFSEIMVRIGLGKSVDGLSQYDSINPNYILLRGVDSEPIIIKKELLDWKASDLDF